MTFARTGSQVPKKCPGDSGYSKAEHRVNLRNCRGYVFAESARRIRGASWQRGRCCVTLGRALNLFDPYSFFNPHLRICLFI